MTQQNKDLLMCDLCARLPYKTLIHIDGLGNKTLNYGDTEDGFINCAPITAIKPYLRKMSSMNEKERMLFNKLNRFLSYDFPRSYESVDWLNQHHFDYRGLIEKGLALEAPKDMYNLEK